MQARVVIDRELGSRVVRGVEHVDGRCLVLIASTVLAVEDDAVVPVLEAPHVIAMRGRFLLTPHHVIELDGDRFPLPALDGAEPVGFLPLPDGALITVHSYHDPAVAAVLRLERRGQVRWRTAIPSPQLAADPRLCGDSAEVRNRRRRLGVTWTWPWGGLCIAGDRALAVFEDSSGIGVGHGLDLETGRVVYTTARGPHGLLAAAPVERAGPGALLVGYQGYGWLETSLVDRHGRVATSWPSYGIVLPGDPMRVLELENRQASSSHAAILHRDGAVTRGPLLAGYGTSPAVIAADGSAVFWRDGALQRLSPDGAQLDRMLATPAPSDALVSLAGHAPGRIALTWSEQRDNAARSRLLVVDVEA